MCPVPSSIQWSGRKGSANFQGGTEEDHSGRHCDTFISFSVPIQINTTYILLLGLYQQSSCWDVDLVHIWIYCTQNWTLMSWPSRITRNLTMTVVVKTGSLSQMIRCMWGISAMDQSECLEWLLQLLVQYPTLWLWWTIESLGAMLITLESDLILTTRK